MTDRGALKRGLWAAAVAFLFASALFLAQRRIDWSYDEEGFQWYGSVAVAHGQVPLRDFYSYDPGRYYWNGAWAKVLGEGVLALRLSTALFGTLGLFLGLLAARRALPRPWLLVPVGAVLLLSMVPRNKLFESALAMAAVYAAVLLLERPSLGRHAGAGAVVGLAGFFGKNLGGYLLLAFLLLIAWQRWRLAAPGEPGLGRRLAAWAGGVALGASPLLLMLAFVPGFFRAYVDSILFFLQQGRTNFPLPVPWPWRVRHLALTLVGLENLCLGVAFLLVPLVLAVSLVFLLRTRREDLGSRVLLLAAFPVGLFYAHHAFSRADLAHLGSSIQPVLLGLVALPAALASRAWRRAAGAAVALVLAAVTLLAFLPASPLFQRLTTDLFWAYKVAGDDLWLGPRMTDFLGWAEDAVGSHVPPGAPILMAPNMPGLYPFFGRLSPVWNVYPIWPSEGRLDQRMLGELKRRDVKWALLQNASVDGYEEFRFRNTHPEVWDYLMTEFETAEVWKSGHPRRGLLLRRKGAVDVAPPPAP
ncbi:MAG: hypothetical protein QOJ16_3063 [Acidobacteriota bacterium]|jgi:hypothetical protein|nr:hypothetical protein [Acidobacteriota bacterium]